MGTTPPSHALDALTGGVNFTGSSASWRSTFSAVVGAAERFGACRSLGLLTLAGRGPVQPKLAAKLAALFRQEGTRLRFGADDGVLVTSFGHNAQSRE